MFYLRSIVYFKLRLRSGISNYLVYSHCARKGRVRKGSDSAKSSGKGKKGPQVFSHVVANSITCAVVP